MAYYPNFYQPNYQQNYQQNSLIWVQGEEAAKSYLVAPNSTVVLWDSEKTVVYIKSADASGMPMIKILDYTIREPQTAAKAPLTENADYVTREEFEGLKAEIKALKEVKGDE